MEDNDAQTLAFYDREASVYAHRFRRAFTHQMEEFVGRFQTGSRILELGCGGGHDTQLLLQVGLDVYPTDGSVEIAKTASKILGRGVSVLRFDDISFQEEFDGVWANACLLHVPRRGLEPVLSRIHAALKPGGLFYANWKAGSAEGRDELGRYYNYPDRKMLSKALMPQNWSHADITESMGGGYDNKVTPWIHLLAVK